MASSINQEEINQILWNACDTFRGIVNSADYKNYILPMLFLKYISDVWEEEHAKIVREYRHNKERIKRRIRRERFIVPDGCHFSDLYNNRHANNVGELINIALEKIEDANKDKLSGVFRNIDFNSEVMLGNTRERNVTLRHLLEDFNDPKLDLRPSRVGNLDIIGNAYEYLIGKFAASGGQKAGEFYTPREVSELIAALVDPQKGERICDPACGSGSLLLKCAKKLLDAGEKNFYLYGQEINTQTYALAKMNMFLHNIDNARLERGDTIRTPLLLEDSTLMKFEVVVANPPFSLDKWGYEEAAADIYNRFHRGLPPKTKGDFAFISHMIATITAVNGRVGVVVPHGVLFRGAGEVKIIEENLVDAVIGLPEKLAQASPPPFLFSKEIKPISRCFSSTLVVSFRMAKIKISCVRKILQKLLPLTASEKISTSMPIVLVLKKFPITTSISTFPAMSIPLRRKKKLT